MLHTDIKTRFYLKYKNISDDQRKWGMDILTTPAVIIIIIISVNSFERVTDLGSLPASETLSEVWWFGKFWATLQHYTHLTRITTFSYRIWTLIAKSGVTFALYAAKSYVLTMIWNVTFGKNNINSCFESYSLVSIFESMVYSHIFK